MVLHDLNSNPKFVKVIVDKNQKQNQQSHHLNKDVQRVESQLLTFQSVLSFENNPIFFFSSIYEHIEKID